VPLCAFESWGYYAVGLTTMGTIITVFWVLSLEWADTTGLILQKLHKRFASLDDMALRVFFFRTQSSIILFRLKRRYLFRN